MYWYHIKLPLLLKFSGLHLLIFHQKHYLADSFPLSFYLNLRQIYLITQKKLDLLSGLFRNLTEDVVTGDTVTEEEEMVTELLKALMLVGDIAVSKQYSSNPLFQLDRAHRSPWLFLSQVVSLNLELKWLVNNFLIKKLR